MRIAWDNLLWVLKHREINEYYYVYGLDRKSKNFAKQVLPYRSFVQIRNNRNLKPAGANFNYAALLQDKFVFGQFMASLHIPTPVNIALLNNQTITWLSTMQQAPLTSIVNSAQPIDGFCKKLSGMQGKGAFRLRIADNKVYIADRESTLTELTNKLDGNYLLQQRVIQHPALDDLFPGALNTMRIVTFNNNGRTEVFNAVLKMGTGNSNVDNWRYGGIAVAIDLSTGTLRKNGFYKPTYGRLVDVHPDTKVRLEEFTVPLFKESLELVCNVHRYLYGIHSIGWDVAVGPDGPIMIEGNEDWDGSFAMAAEENFKTKFLNMYAKDRELA